jgi:hypothetical protein
MSVRWLLHESCETDGRMDGQTCVLWSMILTKRKIKFLVVIRLVAQNAESTETAELFIETQGLIM